MNKHKFFIALFFFFTGFTFSNQTNHIQTIYLGSGCFWGAEKGYEALDGVINAGLENKFFDHLVIFGLKACSIPSASARFIA